MQKLLVIRNDKLGDFVLAFPALALLKKSNPSLKITALVPQYTAPLAEICPYIDDIIIDASNKEDKAAFKQVLAQIKNAHFEAVISFVSTWYNAKLTSQSGINYRLAPATKLFQFLYNHRLAQRRSRSEKPEFVYNMDLARKFLCDHDMPISEPSPPYLSLSPSAVVKQKEMLCQQLGITDKKKWVFVHSGSGGSANNLSLQQYAELIKGLLTQFDCYVVLTAGPNESEKATELANLVRSDLMDKSAVVIYDKNAGLVDFTHSLACADLFIAGSTGPLHLSAALNVPTIGFYPSRLSAIPRRWQPINDTQRHLAFCPPSDKAVQMDLSVISISSCLEKIVPFVENCWKENEK